MGRLGDAKLLGGIGSILQIIPFLSILGYILTLIAVKYVSDEVQDPSIFTDMIYAVLAGIVGVGIGAFVLFFTFIAAAPFAPVTGGASFGFAAFFGLIWFLAIVWVVLIISAVFVRRAFDKISTRLNIGTFRTAGTLYLVGALLTIVFVGLFILLIAFIVQIVAFFSIPEMTPGQPATTAVTMTAAPTTTKFCPACGTSMPAASTFCPKCGARQPA